MLSFDYPFLPSQPVLIINLPENVLRIFTGAVTIHFLIGFVITLIILFIIHPLGYALHEQLDVPFMLNITVKLFGQPTKHLCA